jgi:hypothetical protein
MLEFLVAHLSWSLVPALFSGTSTAISVAKFAKDSKQINFYAALKEAIANPSFKKLIDKGEKDDVVLIEALQFSAVLIEPLRWKIRRHLLEALLIIIGTYGFVELNLEGQLAATAPNFERIDILALLLQITAVLSLSFHRFIGRDERDLLRNVAILNSWFYDNYIHASVVDFNNALSDIKLFRAARGNQQVQDTRRSEFIKKLFSSDKNIKALDSSDDSKPGSNIDTALRAKLRRARQSNTNELSSNKK